MNMPQSYKMKQTSKKLDFSELFLDLGIVMGLVDLYVFHHLRLIPAQTLAPSLIWLDCSYLFPFICIDGEETNTASVTAWKPKEGRLKPWKNQGSNWWISPLMNLVLISESAPDSHDPRGDQWIIRHGVWRWFSKIEVVSGVFLAEVLEGTDYTSNYATGAEACIVLQPISHPNQACETGPSPGRAWSPGGSQALGAQGNCSCQDGSLAFLEWRGGGLKATPSIFTPSASSLALNQAQRWFERNQKWFLWHTLLLCCVLSRYERRPLQVESISSV